MSLSPMSSESMELGAASAPAVTDQDLLNQMHVREHAIGTGNASQLPSAPSPQSSVNTLTPTAAAAAEDHTPEHRHTTGSLTGFLGLHKTNSDSKQKKKSSKQRFQEREARKKEAMLAAAPEEDPRETARLEKEKQEERDSITKTCRELNVALHEVGSFGFETT